PLPNPLLPPAQAPVTIGPNDRPFLDLTTGHVPQTDATTGSIPEGRSIENTIFRLQDPTTDPVAMKQLNSRRLFQTASSGQIGNLAMNPTLMPPGIPRDSTYHPYLSNEMLFKIGGNITNRSNVFAVWLTVGFFEVVDDPSTGRVNLLGEELGQSAGG